MKTDKILTVLDLAAIGEVNDKDIDEGVALGYWDLDFSKYLKREAHIIASGVKSKNSLLDLVIARGG